MSRMAGRATCWSTACCWPPARTPPGASGAAAKRLKGEHFVDHLSGCGLVLNRQIGARDNAKFMCTGINYLIRRELADMTDLP